MEPDARPMLAHGIAAQHALRDYKQDTSKSSVFVCKQALLEVVPTIGPPQMWPI